MSFKRLCLAVSLAITAWSVMAQTTVTLPPVNIIAALDVPRYMGTWYEIAKRTK